MVAWMEHKGKEGSWRLYLESKEARANLLVNKFALKGVQVPVYDKNPFIADNQEDVDASTKLIISNIPLSFTDGDIEKSPD